MLALRKEVRTLYALSSYNKYTSEMYYEMNEEK